MCVCVCVFRASGLMTCGHGVSTGTISCTKLLNTSIRLGWKHWTRTCQKYTLISLSSQCPKFHLSSFCFLSLPSNSCHLLFFPPLHFLCICIFNFSCQLQQLLTFPLTSQFSPLVISTVFSTSLSLPLSSKRVISINVDLRVNRGIFLILFLLTGRAAYSSRHHLRRCVHAILEKWSVSSRSQTSSEGSAPRGRSSSSTSWLTGMRLGSSQFSARPRTSLVAWKLCNTSSRCFDFYNYSENDLLLSFL